MAKKTENIRILVDATTGERYAFVDGKLVPVVENKPDRRKGANKPTAQEKATVEFVLTGKTVSATGFLFNAVWTWNKAKAEEMGATVTVVDKRFCAEFKTAKAATAFHKVATTTIPDSDYQHICENRLARKCERVSRPNKDIAKVIRDHNAQPVGELWEQAKAAYDKNGLDGVEALFTPAKGRGRKSK